MKETYRLVLVLIALYAAMRLALPYLDVLTYSAISATMFYPLYRKLAKYQKEIAAAFCTSLVLVAVVGPLTYTTVFLASQTRDAYRYLVGEGILPPIPAVNELLDTSKFLILQQQNSPAINILLSLVSKIPELLVKLLLFTFLTYYFMHDGSVIRKFITKSFGDFGSMLVKKGERHLNEVVFGNFLTTMTVAAISVLIMWLWGIPYAFTIGALVGIFSVVPLLAVWMVTLPLAVVYYQAQPLFSLTVIFFSLVVGAGTFDVFVRNRFVGGMHPAVFTLGFFGGLSLFGLAGMFIGPVVLSLSIAVIETYMKVKE